MRHVSHRVAQWLAAADWESGGALPLRLRRAGRRRLTKLWDPPVEYPWYGDVLRLPLSHPLPEYRRVSPSYDTPLSDAVRVLARGRDLDVIDVGANVGDTARLVLAAGARRVLCVEGATAYLGYLQANTQDLPTVTIEERFLGAQRQEVRVVAGAGTGSIRAERGSRVWTETFGELLQRHPSFKAAGLLKIDTDGWDLTVLQTAQEWLARTQPAVFFEYDARLHAERGMDISAVWPLLAGCGYTRFVAWSNVGALLDSGPLSLRSPPAVEAGMPYADVLALAPGDVDRLGSWPSSAA